MSKIECQVVVIGGGPAGYTAAFRAADLGRKVVIIDNSPQLGGVCLQWGCIPSKVLLHAANVMNEAAEAEHMGVSFAKPKVDLDKLRSHKEGIISKLTGGLAGMAKGRKIQLVKGTGQFIDANTVQVNGEEEVSVHFEQAIIAVGSHPAPMPGVDSALQEKLWDSTTALNLEEIPKHLLVVGGGIIGLEMAEVYKTLGAEVSMVEFMPQIIPPADTDLVKPLMKRISTRYKNIYLNTKVTGIKKTNAGYDVTFEGDKAPKEESFSHVLVAIGRRSNGFNVNCEKAGVNIDERGFIQVNNQQQTNLPHIYAIGDVVGNPMLAHKGVHEGKVAAEVICGYKSAFEPMTIPSVAYTNPEVAWTGLTEKQAKEDGIKYEVGKFPWAASGRALSIDATDGFSKALFDPETQRLLGMGIVGAHAGELLSEATLAIEMGADAIDIAATIHPHPTLSETVAFAAEMFDGSITDLVPPASALKRNKKHNLGE